MSSSDIPIADSTLPWVSYKGERPKVLVSVSPLFNMLGITTHLIARPVGPGPMRTVKAGTGAEQITFEVSLEFCRSEENRNLLFLEADPGEKSFLAFEDRHPDCIQDVLEFYSADKGQPNLLPTLTTMKAAWLNLGITKFCKYVTDLNKELQVYGFMDAICFAREKGEDPTKDASCREEMQKLKMLMQKPGFENAIKEISRPVEKKKTATSS
ncbi:uncharacterized protein BDZ99DRAFT_519286 [Mytilinidion resinicola]|uniref:Uncharacterized protein n=1 Tax=Mytilinidion resinicola TaxID=574789 RepID=A0A6A6YP86_9PEZI|nr:uncharacterized protein BDZ99DRAFT_519286 [Mytilinidion resinicola]KAF2810590.1 hypothetical protein BDZ99DRAFT_519286 [Mytilinidion resinicola]